MPNPKHPSGLHLHLVDENSKPWEADCDWEGRYAGCRSHCVDGIIEIYGEGEMGAPCPACHGTGKRRVRLVGCVEVKTGAGTIGLWDLEPPIILEEIDYHKVDFIQDIITAHRDGTLPAELMQSDDRPWGLREEVVE